ncbi:hypothetical protein RJ640_024950 [Escallonia rubra]|uniref:Uncharacterized protein n=1 Tax=Escallonia rubra TaxID=112253 RepID=A0AA88RH45_9ASTE|nr:hypothetical protein RJ640_024950 [Escallonia rubra]
MSEEEFGLPGDGHITLSCDAFLMEYIISLIQRGVAEHLEKNVLTSVFGSRCMSSSEYDDEHLLTMDISKDFSTSCVVRFWIKAMAYSTNTASHGNTIGPSVDIALHHANDSVKWFVDTLGPKLAARGARKYVTHENEDNLIE